MDNDKIKPWVGIAVEIDIASICLAIGSIWLASIGSSIWWPFLLASLVRIDL